VGNDWEISGNVVLRLNRYGLNPILNWSNSPPYFPMGNRIGQQNWYSWKKIKNLIGKIRAKALLAMPLII
jgi:hypothetical protein